MPLEPITHPDDAKHLKGKESENAGVFSHLVREEGGLGLSVWGVGDGEKFGEGAGYRNRIGNENGNEHAQSNDNGNENEPMHALWLGMGLGPGFHFGAARGVASVGAANGTGSAAAAASKPTSALSVEPATKPKGAV